MKAAIIKTGAIGDVVRTTSILPGLKEKYKNLSITWIVAKNAYDIIRTNPLVDSVLIFEEINRVYKQFDLVINLEESRKACELASLINKKRLFGAYLENDKIVYSECSRDWFDLSLISRFGRKKADRLKQANKQSYQEIISKSLDIKISKAVLNLTEKEIAFAKQFKKNKHITDNDFVVGINTGAGKRWKYKSLGIEKTTQLIKEIKKEFNAKTIVFGGNEDRKRNKKIIQYTKAIDGTNNSLMEFASLINLCDIIITSDSLALHIAAAFHKKVIVFFGPTSSSEIKLYGKGIKIVPEMSCSGCYKNGCNFDPTCMDMIKISDFIDAIRKLR